MTPQLLDRYSEALSELKSQNCKVQLSVEEIHEVKIRDIRITFGPKEDSDSTPADHIKGNVGFVSFILPKGKSLGNKLFLEAHANGAIFKVDAAINADLHYQITSPSGEILNTRYNRTHVVTFVNPHMEPNSHGLYSKWCWYMDDIDFLLDSEANRFPEGSSDKEGN
ncbi:hypothetical protein DSO57_1021417 [Entomophthora muscae]|nr:hypothetical protein DSO57_1021417 [Entomophthora muscae]